MFFVGASGFVGSHVVKCLLEQGYKVRAVVRDATNEAKTKFLKDLAAQLVFCIVVGYCFPIFIFLIILFETKNKYRMLLKIFLLRLEIY